MRLFQIDETPLTCDTCPNATYEGDDWQQDHTGTYCPDCFDGEEN